MKLAALASFGLLVLPQALWAYPEMIRHGYTSCLICHSSPAGGDLLSGYGKELNRELVSSQWWDSDQKKLYDVDLDLPEKLRVGGNFRALQVFQENERVKQGRFIIMQADVDTKWETEPVSFYASIGRTERKIASSTDSVYIPRLWLSGEIATGPEDKEIFYRVGKFLPIYGVNFPEHAFVSRVATEMTPGSERIGAEVVYTPEKFQISLSLFGERADFRDRSIERGGVIHAAWVPAETFKLGVNLYRSFLATRSLENLGIYGLLGWTKEQFTLVQIDRVQKAAPQSGLALTIKHGWQMWQGHEVFGTLEYWNPNIDVTNPHYEAVGIGLSNRFVSWFDLSSLLKAERDDALGSSVGYAGWVVGHLYF